MNQNELTSYITELGATGIGFVDVCDIKINDEFRGLCENNACGNYGRNYMCPPAYGTMDECRAVAKSYQKAVVVQLIHELEDSFDFEGMQLGAKKHSDIVRSIKQHFEKNYSKDILALAAGGCSLCETCGIITNTPCPNPELTMASVEGYGMDVTQLAALAGMPFKWGEPRVYYVGVVLYN